MISLTGPAELGPFARTLLERLPAGSLLLLDGPMGTGKTALVGELVRQLGSSAAVSSPTYTLIHEYPTPEGTFVHIDAWRLDDPLQLLESGLEDYLAGSRLVAVEWGAPLLGEFPEAALVTLAFGNGDARSVTVRWPS
ncbi:MAG TPA: tRNA (adenosine(37)-N6)-threonylcarbamoyltransferase complex ATPase subunit type 1 TsaE [Deinococcales bacterium]|nr:tRNA (adenosine(37)-N6)-threonylcarbamoyltransferase complex ATPase subunit type 1 TsaE [Deinococcales bacterium]